MPPEWNACARQSRVCPCYTTWCAPIIRCRSASLAVVQPNHRLPKHSTMRRAPAMPLFRTQSAAVLTSLAPHGVRRGCWICRNAEIHGEAMYTAPTLRSACSSSSSRPAMSGVEGYSPRLSLGDSKGVFSSEREYPLWGAAARTPPPSRAVRGKLPHPLGKSKKCNFFEKPT